MSITQDVGEHFSDFWLDDKTKKNLQKKRKGSEDFDPANLASVKRSISQFVQLLTGQRIPVKYRTQGQSFTDGNEVVISADITDETFDQVVGLALHEASHIVKSDFNIFENVEDYIPQDLKDKAEKKFGESEFLEQLSHQLTNYIEDRRIDNWVFTTSPGYKGYYHSMYDAYWHSDRITEQLESDQFREEDMQSYMFRIINLTNPNSDLQALDKLKEIHDLIGLDDIDRFDSTREVFDVALEITEILIEAVDDIDFDENGDIKFGIGEGEEGDGEGETIEWDDLTEAEKEAIKEALEDFEGQLDFLDGDVDKVEIPEEVADELDAIEGAGVSTSEVGEGTGNPHPVDCVIVDKLTNTLILNNSFPILATSEQKRSVEAVERGINLGRRLGDKLKLRNERRETIYPNQKKGKLNQRQLCEVGVSDRLFYRREVDEYDDAFLHISVDASGSMSRDKWSNALCTCVAIIKACDEVDNIHVQVSFRSTVGGGYSSSSTNKPLVLIAYDSERDSVHHVRNYFPHIKSGGTTPAGLTFEAIMDKMLVMDNDQDGYFVNLSDGRPNFSATDFKYGSENGSNHTKRQVERIRSRGIQVLSYYIGNSTGEDSTFNSMYGKDARYITVSNITEIARTMNRKFLKK